MCVFGLEPKPEKCEFSERMKPTHIPTLIALFVALISTGLTAAAGNIEKINPVIIPEGLTPREAKAGMVQAYTKADLPPPATPSPNRWADIVDTLLKSTSWVYALNSNEKTRRGWFIESVEKDAVVFGYRVRAHYLSVRMRITEQKILPQIIASENLKQTETNIHPNAIKWITDLSTQVRVTLGRFSALKAQLNEEDTAPSKV